MVGPQISRRLRVPEHSIDLLKYGICVVAFRRRLRDHLSDVVQLDQGEENGGAESEAAVEASELGVALLNIAEPAPCLFSASTKTECRPVDGVDLGWNRRPMLS